MPELAFDILYGMVLGFLGVRFLVSLVNLLSRPGLRAVGGGERADPVAASSGRTISAGGSGGQNAVMAMHEEAAGTGSEGHRTGETAGETPQLAILVPARNEAENLPLLLDSVLKQDFEAWEVWVLDDHSEDGTGDVVRAYGDRDKRIRVVEGKSLPKGWLGKNWACHQLGQLSAAPWFLFLDADVELGPGALAAGVQEARAKSLALLSLFPDQKMLSTGERIVVPLMHFLLLGLLPLRLVYRRPEPSLAAANGQFMLFDAAVYRKEAFHSLVRKEIVEDIVIMRKVKSAGLKGEVLLGNGFVFCRMYSSLREGINGFTKNILAGFGNSVAGLGIFLLLVVLVWGLLAFDFRWPLWVAGGLLVMAIRICISLAARQPVGWNMLLHPLQMTAMVWISFRSVWLKLQGKREWKGRNVDI